MLALETRHHISMMNSGGFCPPLLPAVERYGRNGAAGIRVQTDPAASAEAMGPRAPTHGYSHLPTYVFHGLIDKTCREFKRGSFVHVRADSDRIRGRRARLHDQVEGSRRTDRRGRKAAGENAESSSRGDSARQGCGGAEK